MYHIVGYSDWNTCSTGGHWTEAWTDSDGVVDRSPTIILWRLPPHCEGHTVPTILLNSGGGSLGRGGRTCWDRKTNIKINLALNCNTGYCLVMATILKVKEIKCKVYKWLIQEYNVM